MELMLKKKNGCPVEVCAEARKAKEEDLEELFALQMHVRDTMEDPEQFLPNERQELLDNIRNNLVIGIWAEGKAIALGILRYDGAGVHNYAWNFGVAPSDVPYWANADTVVVDSAWRGNNLQKTLVQLFMQWRKPEIIGMACTVSPKNQYSLRNMQNSGFEIMCRKVMYGKHDRYILGRTLLPLPGIYRHFKGNLYQVLGSARHSETEEWMVIYRAMYGECGIWVRPATMWSEHIDKAEYSGRSFMYVKEA